MLTRTHQYINTATNRIGLTTLRFWNDETSISNRCTEIDTFLKIKISFVVNVDSHTAVRNIQRDLLLPGFLQFLLLFSHLSHVQLFGTPWTVAHQAPLSLGFSRQEYWSGLPFPSPGDLPNPGIEPGFPALAGMFFTTETLGKPFLQWFSSVQFSCSVVSDSATPWIAARQASLSITNSQSSLRLTSIESVMPSSHLILCRPLLLLPPIPPSISLSQGVNSSHEVARVLEFQL